MKTCVQVQKKQSKVLLIILCLKTLHFVLKYVILKYDISGSTLFVHFSFTRKKDQAGNVGQWVAYSCACMVYQRIPWDMVHVIQTKWRVVLYFVNVMWLSLLYVKWQLKHILSNFFFSSFFSSKIGCQGNLLYSLSKNMIY